MDITSKISLLTAITEFIVVSWAYFKFERSHLSNLIVTLLILLGLTQLLEYGLCYSGNLLWARISFIVYIVIPTLLLQYALRTITIKNTMPIFIPYVFFAITALAMKDFVVTGTCSSGLSSVINTFFFGISNPIPSILNFLYVEIFLFLSGAFLFYRAKKSNDKNEKLIFKLIGGTIFISFLIPTIMVIFIPSIRVYFPSLIERFSTLFLL